MTWYDFEEFLGDCVDIKFANTLQSEFVVYWRKQNIMFMGKLIKYHVYDIEGNEIIINTNNYDDVCKKDICVSVIFEQNLDPIVEDGATIYKPCLTNYDELKIGLKDSCKLNKHKIQEWLKYVKDMYLKTDINLAYEYNKMESKFYHWSIDFLSHTAELRKILLEYESAGLEPDGNIMWDCRKRITDCFNKIDNLYNNYWEHKLT